MNTSITCYDSKGNLLETLTQWDVNVTIVIDGAETDPLPTLHFCQKGRRAALVTETTLKDGKLESKVPNLLLQSRYPLVVYLYYGTHESEQRSLGYFTIPIIPREMPMEYIYQENIGYETWVEMVEEAQRIVEASEALNERIEKADELVERLDADVTKSQTAAQEAGQHEAGAKQALEEALAAQSAAEGSAGEASDSADAAATSAQQASDEADEAKGLADAAAQSQEDAAASRDAAAKSEQDAAQHLADAQAAQQAAEDAQSSAESARDEATKQAADAAASAESAKEYSGKPPIVGENNNWWTWDAEAKEYKDTEHKSVLSYDITYDSVDAMEADQEQPLNTLAIISTDINEEDNAKLYIWDGGSWQFLSDLSGFTGVGITEIEKTAGDGSSGTTDTYRITLDDGTTFDYQVYNGKDGAGDMTSSVYDPNNHNTDIFEYVDSKAPNITVSDDGSGNVTMTWLTKEV